MNEIELRVIDLLLRGSHPVLAILREQAATATVANRRFTREGFTTTFMAPATAPRLFCRDRVGIGDVWAELAGLPHEALFVAFVQDGVLQALQGFHQDGWPVGEVELTRLYYTRPLRPGSTYLMETPERDLDWALKNLLAKPGAAPDRGAM
jgi:hypothetical protein